MKRIQLIYSLDTLDEAVDLLCKQMEHCSIFTLQGSLGAGKTTLVKRLLKRCGVDQTITSPTYTYVVRYTNAQGQVFYHFDLYRLQSLQEFYDAGFDEYLFDPQAWSFVEWPEILLPILDTRACQISIDYSDHQRKLVLTTD